MRNVVRSTVSLMWMSLAASTLASEAETSAAAGNNRRGDGFATATATYEGDIGFAGTRTHTGEVSLARGLAVGFDEDGLSFSASHAISTRWGIGIARNFTLTLGRDGQVAVSGGTAVSRGQRHQSAEAGGWAGSEGHRTVAASTASGTSDRRGTVTTRTHARSLRVERWHRSRD